MLCYNRGSQATPNYILELGQSAHIGYQDINATLFDCNSNFHDRLIGTQGNISVDTPYSEPITQLPDVIEADTPNLSLVSSILEKEGVTEVNVAVNYIFINEVEFGIYYFVLSHYGAWEYMGIGNSFLQPAFEAAAAIYTVHHNKQKYTSCISRY